MPLYIINPKGQLVISADSDGIDGADLAAVVAADADVGVEGEGFVGFAGDGIDGTVSEAFAAADASVIDAIGNH